MTFFGSRHCQKKDPDKSLKGKMSCFLCFIRTLFFFLCSADLGQLFVLLNAPIIPSWALAQRVQSTAAIIVTRTERSDHSPILRQLHWLLVEWCIDYKNYVPCECSGLNGTATQYTSRWYRSDTSTWYRSDTSRLVPDLIPRHWFLI